MKKNILITVFLLVCIISGQVYSQEGKVYQISTIDALLKGLYDGIISSDSLKAKGDTGLGTFHSLEGEMVYLNGVVYQVKADGNVYIPKDDILIPFAAVCFFSQDTLFNIPKANSFHSLETKLDSMLITKNHIVCFRIEGEFSFVKTRSVPAQDKPYKELKYIAATQPVFERENTRGTIVGFRCPIYVKGINVPGYHFHFLSEDKKFGGHLLDFKGENLVVNVDYTNSIEIELPARKDFTEMKFGEDLSSDLKKVEK